jgi:hypothetical protein
MPEADVPAYVGGDGVEERLPRGDVTEAVVRVGQTVRRPAQPQSAAVADYLEHLRAAGFDGAPRFLGRDRSGRDVLDYLGGCPEFRGTSVAARLSGDVSEVILHDGSDSFANLAFERGAERR